MKTQDKKTIIEVAKAIRRQNHEMKDFYRIKGDEKTADEYLIRACEWTTIINLLEDERFCEIIARNLGIKDAE